MTSFERLKKKTETDKEKLKLKNVFSNNFCYKKAVKLKFAYKVYLARLNKS